jgi:hypothetical protein
VYYETVSQDFRKLLMQARNLCGTLLMLGFQSSFAIKIVFVYSGRRGRQSTSVPRCVFGSNLEMFLNCSELVFLDSYEQSFSPNPRRDWKSFGGE